MPGIGVVTARAGVERRRKHESGRIAQRHRSTGYRHLAVLQRLTQVFEHVFCELRQLVQKKHAVVAQAYFAGSRVGTAANEAGIGNRMVWGPEWPRGHERSVRIKESGNRMDLGCFQCFVKSAIREY